MHADLKPTLLRTTQLELPPAPAPEMAFSGQYAAAQLEKLDNSPMFRGRTFSLAKEIAAYLGYTPDFVPPTYLTFARAHDRIPTTEVEHDLHTHAVTSVVLKRDLRNFNNYAAAASVLRFRNDILHIDFIAGVVFDLTWMRPTPVFAIEVEVPRSPEDLEFFNRWLAVHGVTWPYTRDNEHHPALQGAIRTCRMYEEEWRAERERRRRAVAEYNMTV